MLVHDIIKIKYVNLGYIKKNYPYHLISDEEMFNAFIDLGDEDFNKKTTVINPEVRFFDDYYPNPFTDDEGYPVREYTDYYEAYTKLRSYIVACIKKYLQYYGTTEESTYTLPDWIYTYMLGEVIYKQSEYKDIEDILELLHCDNYDNDFTIEACIACYNTSLNYVSKLTTGTRPPTVFGEPHVIKYLRMEN